MFNRAQSSARVTGQRGPGSSNQPYSSIEERVIRKAFRAIIPISVLGLFVSFIDRTNISVAGPDLETALGLTPTMFGLASGLFFIGYVFAEIPSNLALRRYGARGWIALIMVTWGVVSILTIFVKGATSFYLMRFVLGIVEAGFYPGILYYLSLFVPNRRITRAFALYQIGIPVSLALGSVLTSAILTMNGVLGVSGWQWVFIIEGACAVIVGVVCYFTMANSPATVRWLDAEEKQVLQQAIDREQGDDEDADLHGWKATVVILRNPEVWFYSGVYLLMMLGFYSVTYWLPQIIQQKMDTGSVESGLLSAIPWAVATGALFLVSWYTSRHGRRAQMLTAILIVCTAGMLVGSLVGNPEIALVGLCFGACIQAAVPLLYSFPSQHFPGAKGAVALALVNTIGNIGGFAGPYLLGWLREATGTDKAGLLILASSFALAAILSTQLPRALRRSPTYAPVVD